MSRPRAITAALAVAAIVAGAVLLVLDREGGGPVVEMGSGGFSPATLTVGRGETVTFRNTGDRESWPASDVHPTHEEYPGFDAGAAVLPGESWTFRFDRSGSWTFHDHLSPEVKGTIIVG